MKNTGSLQVMVAVLLVAFILGCIGGQETTTTSVTETTLRASAGEVIIQVSGKLQLGSFLADGNNLTLYTFKNDESGKSNCYGQCAINWPPLQAGSHNLAGEGVIGTIGVIDRTDGKRQLTYDGMPLYYFAGDKNFGDTNGQGVNNVWFVVSPAKATTTSQQLSTTLAPTPTTVASPTTTVVAAPPITISAPVLQEFALTAKRFSFDPDTIRVHQGDRVRITATTQDVTHGFAINEYGINQMISPGNETIIEFVADKKGSFTFFCNVPCGSGHRSMQGALIVE